jgi:putative transposase
MDGKGCWRDNIFVERLWRSLEYEAVHLHAYDSVAAANAVLGRYLTIYNTRRPRSSMDDRMLNEADIAPEPLAIAA